MSKKQYILDKRLEESEVKKMSKDELKRYYQWTKIDCTTYIEKRANATHTKIFDINFMPSGGRKEVVKRNKIYNGKHKDENERVIWNLRLIEKYLGEDCFSDEVYEDILDSEFIRRIGKENLIEIVSKLNQERNLNMKLSGTIDELIRELKDNIGKKDRNEVIGEMI